MDIQNFKNLKEKNKILFTGLLIILAVFLLALTVSTIVGTQNKIKEGKYIGQEIETRNTITVSGKGEVYAKPDLALTTFSVVTDKKTVAEAISENAKKMNAVIDFIKKQGVEDKDLKTVNFNISPRYEWYDVTQFYPQGRRVLVGYEVQQSLEVKIRDMDKIGSIIQGATDSGANEVGDLQFTIDNQDELKKQAGGEAIEKAKNKAEELASQLGVRLVRITNFSESGVVPYYGLMKEAVGMGGSEEAAAPAIETGENKIEVDVTITYEIN
jgi:uncharacterized protein YggE